MDESKVVKPDVAQWNDGLTSAMLSEWTLGLVQKAIWCPYTHEVLDISTCDVLVDGEGTPTGVVSPKVTEAIREKGSLERMGEQGVFILHRDGDGVWEVAA